MNSQASSFLKILKHPVQFRMFLFRKIPSAFFSGVKIKEADENRCVVAVPFKWFTQNPFRSTYFACLGMAAEMSTGALAMMHTYLVKPPISMLVTKSDAQYFKKATGKTYFICEEGKAIYEAIEYAYNNADGQTITVKSTGVNDAGDKIAEFNITWSFKKKKG
jgi:Domain of unknown function (DUF4442)